ncbi:MAG: hypothetical protein QNK68_02490 [Flavobacteriales bacterium]
MLAGTIGAWYCTLPNTSVTTTLAAKSWASMFSRPVVGLGYILALNSVLWPMLTVLSSCGIGGPYGPNFELF